MILSEREVARARYLAAAKECWSAWKAYFALGAEKEVIAFHRFALPAPDGHARTDDGLLFDRERD